MLYTMDHSNSTGEIYMEYSVEGLAKLSGVSVRTLHYYDEIGLLKPRVRMANGRRYYGTKQFLQLQKILFFKEIGLSLKEMKPILALDNKKNISMLAAQKQVLVEEIVRLEKVTNSIDKMIEHYKGATMSEQEICDQFENFQNKMKIYRKAAEEKFGKEVMEENIKNMEGMDKEFLLEYTKRAKELSKKIVELIKRNVDPASEEAQALMEEHDSLAREVSPTTKETYIRSLEGLKDPNLNFMYEVFHPQFSAYMYQMMEVFFKKHF